MLSPERAKSGCLWRPRKVSVVSGFESSAVCFVFPIPSPITMVVSYVLSLYPPITTFILKQVLTQMHDQQALGTCLPPAGVLWAVVLRVLLFPSLTMVVSCVSLDGARLF